MLPVWIGYDRREDLAYKVCRHSIESRTVTVDAPVSPLIQDALRASDQYLRPHDKLASTDFSLTRFLIPHLQQFKGWALYCDCDIIFTKSLQHLWDLRNDKYAIMVVKHDYTPHESVKMDGMAQMPYPRKNWSSVMFFNCSHPANRKLTAVHVNHDMPKELHRLGWLKDEDIGELPKEWNYLVGVYPKLSNFPPAALHFTLGTPAMQGYENCDYAEEWHQELSRMKGWK